MKNLICILLLCISSAICVSQKKVDSSRLYDFFRLARQASSSQQYLLSKKFLDNALLITPDFSDVRYAHLRACLRANLIAEALADIDHMLRLKLVKTFDIASDSLIKAILENNQQFKKYLEALKIFESSKGVFHEAFRVEDKLLIPEGTAYDSVAKYIYLSSIYQRKVIRVDSMGNVEDFVRSRQDDLLAVTGLAINANKRILYLCSGYSPQIFVSDTSDIRDKRTAIYAYSLETGKLIHKYKSDSAVFFNDLTIASNGDIYTTDSDGNAVYHINTAEQNVSKLVTESMLYGPNGITFDAEGRYLYIAAYLSGLYKVDVTSGKGGWVKKEDSISLAGIDGLEWYNNSVIVNSPSEHKAIRRLYFNNDQSKIIREEILACHPKLIHETTTGTIIGNRFYFIANSGIDAYRNDGSLATDKLEAPVIMQCILK
jgi:sugar lactone lactonase YvrE